MMIKISGMTSRHLKIDIGMIGRTLMRKEQVTK